MPKESSLSNELINLSVQGVEVCTSKGERVTIVQEVDLSILNGDFTGIRGYGAMPSETSVFGSSINLPESVRSVLPPEQERSLLIILSAGPVYPYYKRARKTMFWKNVNLVERIIQKHWSKLLAIEKNIVGLEDVRAEGKCILLDVIDLFKVSCQRLPGCMNKFSSFAYPVIDRRIERFVEVQRGSNVISGYTLRSMRICWAIAYKLQTTDPGAILAYMVESGHKKMPGVDRLNYSKRMIQEVMSIPRTPYVVSVDDFRGNDEGLSLLETIPGKRDDRSVKGNENILFLTAVEEGRDKLLQCARKWGDEWQKLLDLSERRIFNSNRHKSDGKKRELERHHLRQIRLILLFHSIDFGEIEKKDLLNAFGNEYLLALKILEIRTNLSEPCPVYIYRLKRMLEEIFLGDIEISDITRVEKELIKFLAKELRRDCLRR